MRKSRGYKKVIVARSAGFCWGVQKAFDKVLKATKAIGREDPLYTYGPLIHNPEAVEMLKAKGVRVLDEIPEKLRGSVFIRTHGISPDERVRLRRAGAAICDTTCPDVGSIQGIVKRHLKKGYHIIIVGNKEHPEVKALLGFAEGRGISVSSASDIGKVPAGWERVCVVAQSTQKEEDFIGITELLRKNYSDCRVYNTICRSTTYRQKEVRKLSQMVDAMIVVGGLNSANTNKLARISRETGTPTFHIEGAGNLNVDDFNEFDTIGVTAGASTPRWSIEKVIERFRKMGDLEVVEFSDEDRGGRLGPNSLTSGR